MRLAALAEALAGGDAETARAVTREQLTQALELLADLHATVR